MRHGTPDGYRNHGCRCEACTRAASAHAREYRYRRGLSSIPTDREALSDLLHEVCPDGLTDDCPARRRAAA